MSTINDSHHYFFYCLCLFVENNNLKKFCLVQVASFPFKANTSFLIVLPLPGKGNVSSVLPKLNISDLYRRLPQEKTMQVNLPKVKLQYRHELQEALTSMGENVVSESEWMPGRNSMGTVVVVVSLIRLDK